MRFVVQPDKSVHCSRVDLGHHCDLVIALSDVLLVDTQLVYPEVICRNLIYVVLAAMQCLEERMKVGSDLEVVLADGDLLDRGW